MDKFLAPWMFVISQTQKNRYLVTCGDPYRMGSTIKFSGGKEDLLEWVASHVGSTISADHVIDTTTLNLVPKTWSDFFMATVPATFFETNSAFFA